VSARGDRLQALLAERELERILVTNLTNVRYLTGFRGTNGACLCGPDQRLFLTDFRYTERAAAEVDCWEVVTVAGDWLAGLAERLQGTVGFEDQHLSVRAHRELQEKAGEGAELRPAGDPVESLRRVKDDAELGRIAEAAKLADEVYRWSLERGLGGRTEREVARAAASRIREPGDREIGRREMVVFDMGAELDGYCSDCTRTFATGEPGEEARAVYELVREAQARALEALSAGKGGREVDAVAREVIVDGGHGDHFGHGLGHGVGLEVHEAPRLATRSEDTLSAGEVVTVEPGVYVPGEFGVRIEDLVVVAEDGHRNLSGLPKELTPVE
jgi:Xaa-Pro aminopeptidase